MTPYLSVVFRRLVRLGSFQACWRQTNITPIQKGALSSSIANYRPISIISVLSKVFDHLVSVRSERFMECSCVLLTTQFSYRNGLDTCDALLCLSHTLQSALDSGLEARSALCCLYWYSFYQTDHSTLRWMVIGVNWLMLYQDCRMSVFWASYCFSCTLRSLFSILEYKLIGSPDDSFFMTFFYYPQVSELQ